MVDWKRLAEFVRVDTRWVRLVGEHWLAERDTTLEYWRVERPDSVIVLPTQSDWLFCVAPTFRPGLGRATLDFPGGRLSAGQSTAEAAQDILNRELGIPREAIALLRPLNSTKWNVDSSFSNQGLWAFHALIENSFIIPDALIGAKIKTDAANLAAFAESLDCLQCRAVLREWQLSVNNKPGFLQNNL